MAKTHKRKVRTPAERRLFYKDAKSYGGEETEQKNKAVSLDGSDDSYGFGEYDSNQDVKKPSFGSKISLHTKEIILTVIIIPVLLACIKWIIDVKAEQKYINYALEDVRHQIEEVIPGNGEYSLYVTKENLELKLQLLERDLEALIPDVSQIEVKLEAIENEIIAIRNNSDK